MDFSVLYAICTAIVTLTLVVVSIVVIRTLRRAQRSLEQLERTASRLEPVIRELEATLHEIRELRAQVSDGVTSLRSAAARAGKVGSRVLEAGEFLFGAGGGTVNRAFALFRALRAGVGAFCKRPVQRESQHGRPQASDGSPEVQPAVSKMAEGARVHAE